MIRVQRALLSVHDKRGLLDLARGLRTAGVELVSTGGTAKLLFGAGLDVQPVSDVTGFPELFDGRVKTLHPHIHGAILFRRDHAGHVQEAETAGIRAIDLVVVNLYPFERTVEQEGVTRAAAIEEIDIGGVALLRAAAKNHDHVCVVADPADYAEVLDAVRGGGVSEALARRLAGKAFERTASYDAAIAAWLDDAGPPTGTRTLLEGVRHGALRYGENPHQAAEAHVIPGEAGGVLQARLVQGKELSWNNICDLDAAWTLVRDLEKPGVGIVKHANPCGAAEGGSLLASLAAARACDPVSAFGGVFAFNGRVDSEVASAVIEGFVECVIAPAFAPEALEVFSERKNVRVLEGELPPRPRHGREWKRVTGALLVQDWDDEIVDELKLEVVTKRAPTPAEREALGFAWRACRHVKSNAIVFAAPGRTLGIGAGQMSRVDAVELAAWKAKKSGLDLTASVVASDAFFPFRDGLDAAAAAGATAAVQPGGSKRDAEVIAAADEHGMAMVFTGIRHFRH